MTAPTPRGLAARRCHPLAPALAISLLLALADCTVSHVPAPLASLPMPASTQPAARPAAPALVDAGPEMFGTASWYRPGPGLHRTCTGERFTRNEMTAASHTIPLGTRVRVTLLDDDRSIIVRVNDCMPRNHRLLDLSEAAAKQLGFVNMGIARVTVTPVSLADNR